MNFLSHYYFDRENTSCYFVLGTVLPDLLKNADKSIILHPEKLVSAYHRVNAIIQGWDKHLLVDKYFHTSEFFLYHSHQLKKQLAPAISGSPVKPFFLGHIAIELILDNLLLTTGQVSVDEFYEHLKDCDDDAIGAFLAFAGMKNPQLFFKFYNGFKNSRYLTTYKDISQVTYALKRICMRIWKDPFTVQQEMEMTGILTDYRQNILHSFTGIYQEISKKLSGAGG